jgi:hypothetical protein
MTCMAPASFTHAHTPVALRTVPPPIPMLKVRRVTYNQPLFRFRGHGSGDTSLNSGARANYGVPGTRWILRGDLPRMQNGGRALAAILELTFISCMASPRPALLLSYVGLSRRCARLSYLSLRDRCAPPPGSARSRAEA